MARHPSFAIFFSRLTGITAVAGSLMLSGLGCSDDDVKFDATKPVRVETDVAPTAIEAGGTATVTCVLYNGKDQPLSGGQFAVAIAPVGPVATGLSVRSERSGTFALACSDTSLGLLDDTPAQLVVNPGPAASTTIALSASTVAAGVQAGVTCTVLDAFGNVTTAPTEVRVSPTTSVTVASGTSATSGITATAAGDYEVTCFSANLGAANLGSATLTVTPNERVGIRLTKTPDLVAYGLAQPITLIGIAIDAYNNDIPGTVAVNTLDAAPAGHHNVLGAGQNLIRFDLEGKYTVSAKAIDIPAQSATLPVVVDQTAPVLTLTEPARGLVTDSLNNVRVAGTVTDNLGEVAELRIGDTPIPLSPQGGNFSAFSIDVPLKYALNLLDIVAIDPYGNDTLVTRAVEKSTQFHPMVERSFGKDGIANGLVLVLAQAAFDDGDQTEASRDDLAHLFKFIIENIDFTSFVPDPLTTFSCISGSCTVRFKSVTIDDVVVHMTLMNGKIRLEVELIELAGTIALFFPCNIQFICPTRPTAELPGTLSTNKVRLVTDLLVSIINGEIVTQTENTQVTIDGLDVTIADPTGIAQAAITGAVTFIRPALIAAMEVTIESLVEDQLAAALGGLFGALTINEEFELPSPVPGQAGNTIVISTEPKGVDIGTERLQVRVDAIAFAKTPQRPHAHLGSIGHRGCAPPTSLTFPPVAPIVVGLHDDLINQLIFAVWEGGTLALDLGPEESAALVGEFGLEGATIKVDALLPPVFDSCGRGNTLQLGDLYLEFDADFLGQPTKLGVWLQAEAPVGVDITETPEGALQAALTIGELDPLLIEVVINEGAFSADDQLVVNLIQDVVIPQLLTTVADSATFTLPSFDLGALTTAVPAGTIVNIDVRQIGRDNAYLTLEGALK
jgi:hypothetical protein